VLFLRADADTPDFVVDGRDSTVARIRGIAFPTVLTACRPIWLAGMGLARASQPLVIADIVGCIHRWQCHGHQTEKLHQVVSHHVAQCASLFVVTGAMFNPNRLGDGYHDMVGYLIAVANLRHRPCGDALRSCDRESRYPAASGRCVSDARFIPKSAKHEGSRQALVRP
jgi:hypothetical protein